jgi:hypothetical protein
MNFAQFAPESVHKYSMSIDARAAADMLSPETYAKLHNLRSTAVEELCTVAFVGTREQIHREMMTHAAITARIALLTELLEDSVAAQQPQQPL